MICIESGVSHVICLQLACITRRLPILVLIQFGLFCYGFISLGHAVISQNVAELKYDT